MIIGRLVNGKFVKIYDSDENSGDNSAAVLYVEQSLTAEQKAQARENIGITGTGGGTNFLSMEVDNEGNLYMIVTNSETAPTFTYDENTGNLYVI